MTRTARKRSGAKLPSLLLRGKQGHKRNERRSSASTKRRANESSSPPRRSRHQTRRRLAPHRQASPSLAQAGIRLAERARRGPMPKALSASPQLGYRPINVNYSIHIRPPNQLHHLRSLAAGQALLQRAKSFASPEVPMEVGHKGEDLSHRGMRLESRECPSFLVPADTVVAFAVCSPPATFPRRTRL
jgi:hypothetical protein